MVAAKIWTSRKLTQKKLKVEINFYGGIYAVGPEFRILNSEKIVYGLSDTLHRYKYYKKCFFSSDEYRTGFSISTCPCKCRNCRASGNCMSLVGFGERNFHFKK